ncbi:adenine phosphoribosyltransferase [Sulfurivirga caldicuralii]|uniref:Adenine phosphoribosyltransferase n=1 Tax=Sulfurivirga caldicuralii TaxID=364032 RepID=A0A1N6DB76_9GAMM|nr:adenine phosphoribosyltransferase [Sulfurivirga caldicuralii]SIN68072.1 adenine phosphoribosyltransferase [Sulfurivirga caldicuralii]
MHPFAQYIDNVPDFPKSGILFRDVSPLLRQKFSETIDAMSDLFTPDEWAQVDHLVGIESRGFIFASALAYKHGKGFVKVRKPGKLPNVCATIAYGLEYGSDELQMQKGDSGKVIICDDLIATGGSMKAAADLCEQVGYEVVGLACLVDLKALNDFEWHGMRVRSVIQYED